MFPLRKLISRFSPTHQRRNFRNFIVLIVSMAGSVYCAVVFQGASDMQFFFGVLAGIRDDKLTEAEVMPRLVADFPSFRPRWEKHLGLWKGKPAGSYNDVAEFAHFVVKDLYSNGNSADLQRAFDLMEHWLVNGNQNLRELIAIGFLEDVQNVASWHGVWKRSVHSDSRSAISSGVE